MKTLRRLAATLLLLLAAAPPALAVERILYFLSDVSVQRNGDLIVTETIRVEAEGREIRRGILRDFPTIYTDRRGLRVEAGFTVQSVTRDGYDENFAIEHLANGVRVRIGRADQTINVGQHEYVIRYRTTRQVGFFDDFDELYWNATGTGWTFAIDVAEARITLPERVGFTQSAFYTGPQGATGKDAQVAEQTPGRIVFRTTRPLPPRNGLTVAAAWPKGIVLPPTASQKVGEWMQDNPAILAAVLGFVLIAVFYLFAWLRVGRDPPRGTIIPLFEPPEGMSAAAVRYVKQMGFDQRCFTAAVVDLGVKGHLKIEKDDYNTTLVQRDADKPVPSPEQEMKRKLFVGGQTLFLDKSNYRTIDQARTALSDGLSKTYLGKFFRNNFAWSGIGLLLVFLLVVAVAILIATSHDSDPAGGLIVGLALPLIPIMLGAAMVATGWQRYEGGTGLIIGGIALVVIFVVAGLVITGLFARGPLDFVPAVVGYLLAPLAGLAFRWLQAPTPAGRAVIDRIDGFQMYLGVAEEDRLNALNPPDKTPELFERFLPYAIALDAENRWAKRFAGVLAAAGAAAVATTWYSGSDNWTSDPVRFADQLGGSLNDTIAAAATPPGSSGSSGGSSGSGGGGSSGGGGGGGGGSGW